MVAGSDEQIVEFEIKTTQTMEVEFMARLYLQDFLNNFGWRLDHA